MAGFLAVQRRSEQLLEDISRVGRTYKGISGPSLPRSLCSPQADVFCDVGDVAAALDHVDRVQSFGLQVLRHFVKPHQVLRSRKSRLVSTCFVCVSVWKVSPFTATCLQNFSLQNFQFRY